MKNKLLNPEAQKIALFLLLRRQVFQRSPNFCSGPFTTNRSSQILPNWRMWPRAKTGTVRAAAASSTN